MVNEEEITKGAGHGNCISARIVITIFQTETNHVISYSGGGNKTQIESYITLWQGKDMLRKPKTIRYFTTRSSNLTTPENWWQENM